MATPPPEKAKVRVMPLSVPRARARSGSGVGQGDVSGSPCGRHTHARTDVAPGEGNRQGGLWSTAGLEPEFPLWLGLTSLPLTFLGDPRWFLPAGLTAAEERQTTVLRGEVLRQRQVAASTGASVPLASAPNGCLGPQPCSAVRDRGALRWSTLLSAGRAPQLQAPRGRRRHFYPDFPDKGTEA